MMMSRFALYLLYLVKKAASAQQLKVASLSEFFKKKMSNLFSKNIKIKNET